MNSPKKPTKNENQKTLLSTLWIFVTVNYIFCDLLSAEFLKQILGSGELLGMAVNQKFLLGSAIFMEIPFAMILLSRVSKYRSNRWANLIAGMIMTLAQIASLFVGTLDLYYIFYSTIEISTTIFIVWYAWKWVDTKN